MAASESEPGAEPVVNSETSRSVGGRVWDWEERPAVPIPDGLAALPPGAELAQALASINVAMVSGYDTVEVLKAAYRQSCHDRAWFLQVMLEVGLREQFSAGTVRRLAVPEEFAPDEARAALVWSRRRADSTFELAWNVHRRLPVLGEAMLAGVLDEPRAAAFICWTTGLTDEQAALVCDHLVDQAGRWTVGELIEHIQRLVLAIDPGWAEKRYTEAVKRRRVVGARNDDGTASVSGLDLPVDRAAAGCERIDELARSCKRAGDRRPIDHIRADLFLGSLDGTFEGLTDEQIITHIRTHPFLDTPPNTSTDTDPGTDPDPGPSTPDPSSPDTDPDAGPNGPDTDPGTDPDAGPDGLNSSPATGRGADLGGAHTPPDADPGTGTSGPDSDPGAGLDGPHTPLPDPPGRASTNPSAGPTVGPSEGTPAGPPVDPSGGTTTGPPTDPLGRAPAHPADGPCGGAPAGSLEGGVPHPGAASPRHAHPQDMPATALPDPGAAAPAAPGRRDRLSRLVRGWAVPELRVELSTLLGLDEHPAHAPGWGM
ncbi:DUF222 domain-containing protein, partial [Microbispora sp. NPDC049125]|uniref:DUF222 domain-containing protein n=1 Tax=Microbispora sp. NPDC049125 TaxID=3154929 RepID=UPI003466BF09